MARLSRNQREERPREELLREYWNLGEDGPWCTQQADQHSIFCTAQYRIYCAGWPAFYTTDHLHLSFNILSSQLRQTADRAAGLCIKSLGQEQYFAWYCIVVSRLKTINFSPKTRSWQLISRQGQRLELHYLQTLVFLNQTSPERLYKGVLHFTLISPRYSKLKVVSSEN